MSRTFQANLRKPPRLPPRPSISTSRKNTPTSLTPNDPSPTSITQVVAKSPQEPSNAGTSSADTSETNPVGKWVFKGTELYCDQEYHERRMQQIRQSTNDCDGAVPFAFQEGVFTVSRAVLTNCQSPLSFAAKNFKEAKMEFVRLYDEDNDAPALASVIRFLSGVHVDLSASRAPAVALAAFRWRVPTLFLACFAIGEQLPPTKPSITAWVPTLSYWLPVFDSIGSSHAFSKSMPFRFRSIFTRRVALLMSHLISITSDCSQCGLPIRSENHKSSTARTPSRNEFKNVVHNAHEARPCTRPSPSCMMCARLVTGRSVWHAFYRSGLLGEILRESVRMHSPEVTAHLYQVLVISLHLEEPNQQKILQVLRDAKWDSGWACACRNLVSDERIFHSPRLSSLVTHTFLNASDHESRGALFIGSVHNQLGQLSEYFRNDASEVQVLHENEAAWNHWKVTLSCVVKRVNQAQEASADSKHDVGQGFEIWANITVKPKRINEAGDGNDESMSKLRAGRTVNVRLEIYVGGCECELGCAKIDQCGNGICRIGTGDKQFKVKVDWKRIRTTGISVLVLSANDIREWFDCHELNCNMHVNATVQATGIEEGGLDKRRSSESGIVSESGSSDISPSDAEGDKISNGDTEHNTICACKNAEVQRSRVQIVPQTNLPNRTVLQYSQFKLLFTLSP